MITCRSSPGEKNTQTEVTFVLPEDVNETKKSFTVYHYNDQSFRSMIHFMISLDLYLCSYEARVSLGQHVELSDKRLASEVNKEDVQTPQMMFYPLLVIKWWQGCPGEKKHGALSAGSEHRLTTSETKHFS